MRIQRGVDFVSCFKMRFEGSSKASAKRNPWYNSTKEVIKHKYADMSLEETKSESDTETPGASREKICKVCGDKALGYNFNALTCESCKAFFRRNALKNKEFKCPFDKKCEINPITRRFCQLCRLIKCFEIGMRKEYIMSEDDKREKRKKIETNRAIKKRAADGSNEPSLQPKSTKLENKKDESTENEDEVKQTQTQTQAQAQAQVQTQSVQSVKINLLNMASTSKKTYQKKQPSEYTNADQPVSFPSPGLPEPCPDTVSVTESRTCNVFNTGNSDLDSSQSRSLEIYQISKGSKERDVEEKLEKDRGESDLIQIFLDSEFSKPAVCNDSTVFKETKVCNSKDDVETGGGYVISEATILELTKSNKNILLESRKDGKRILVLSKNSVVGSDVQSELSRKEGSKDSDPMAFAPVLTSLINSGQSSNGSSSSCETNPTREILREVSRDTAFDTSNSIDSILSEAIKLEYEAYTSMNPRMNSRELNDAERAKLNELIVANKALLAPLEDDMTGDDFGFNVNSGCKRSTLVDVLNLTAVAIRRLIKMSKKINAFKNMCQDDQIALLKGGCTEMMILRSAMTYDPDRDSWKIPQSKEKLMNIKVDVLKEAGGKVFEEHERFLQTFDQKWRNDENIMLILSAIALFTPDRARVVHSDVIKLEQNSYYYLLRRYLESIYQGCEARLTFLKLIHKISELHKLNEDHVRVYLDVNPKEVEPLLIEIFDLKPH